MTTVLPRFRELAGGCASLNLPAAQDRLAQDNVALAADAKAEVLQKLDEVPGYPNGVLQPVVEGVDPESVDYISWIGLASNDTIPKTTQRTAPRAILQAVPRNT